MLPKPTPIYTMTRRVTRAMTRRVKKTIYCFLLFHLDLDFPLRGRFPRSNRDFID